jgi:ectoine hydroxylase-related dioxygenase (phytanoyl-CoA dioxygenase family)
MPIVAGHHRTRPFDPRTSHAHARCRRKIFQTHTVVSFGHRHVLGVWSIPVVGQCGASSHWWGRTVFLPHQDHVEGTPHRWAMGMAPRLWVLVRPRTVATGALTCWVFSPWMHCRSDLFFFVCVQDKCFSCIMAIDQHTKENGCLQVLKGSHKLGRLEHGIFGGQAGIDPVRLGPAMDLFELVHCELEAGDMLFTHSK